MTEATVEQTDNLRAGAWLVADMSLNVWALAIVKALGLGYPASQIVFLRAGVGLLLVLPWAWRRRAAFRGLDRPGLHVFRILLSAVTLTTSYFAVARLPLALYTAVNFTRPLILMAMAALILGERIGARRWMAGIAGLAGVLLAVSPGNVAWNLGLAALMVTVVTGTGAVVVTRQLRGTAPVVMMAFYTGGLAVLSAPVAAVAWEPVAGAHLLPLLAVGVLTQTGQYCFLRAHWLGDAGVLAPLGYLSLFLAALVGFAVFGEVPTRETVAGAAIILGATLLVAEPRRVR